MTSNLTYDYTVIINYVFLQSMRKILLIVAFCLFAYTANLSFAQLREVFGYRGHHGRKYDTYCTPTCILWEQVLYPNDEIKGNAIHFSTNILRLVLFLN